MTQTQALLAALLGAAMLCGCTRTVQATDAAQIEQQYGLTGAFAETISTDAGALQGTLVPITLAGGRQAHLFIPTHQSKGVEAVYLRDDQGLHPVRLTDRAKRDDMVRAPALVTSRPARQVAAQRSWEREVLIVAGSAGAGAVIGGLAAGKKGAGVGAAAGGVGGLVYDLLSRRTR
jgi:hypothetical protein